MGTEELMMLLINTCDSDYYVSFKKVGIIYYNKEFYMIFYGHSTPLLYKVPDMDKYDKLKLHVDKLGFHIINSFENNSSDYLHITTRISKDSKLYADIIISATNYTNTSFENCAKFIYIKENGD